MLGSIAFSGISCRGKILHVFDILISAFCFFFQQDVEPNEDPPENISSEMTCVSLRTLGDLSEKLEGAYKDLAFSHGFWSKLVWVRNASILLKL